METVERSGIGPSILFVHGEVMGPDLTWSEQRELAHRRPLDRQWEVVLPHLRGYGDNPDPAGTLQDDVEDVISCLEDPTHLVAHSRGAVVATLAALREPEMVRSLTLVEPLTLSVASRDDAVDQLDADLRELWDTGPADDPAAFLNAYLDVLGPEVYLPDPLPPPLERSAEALISRRLPDELEADIPFGQLRGLCPLLVISGDGPDAVEHVCDHLAEALDAERAVIPAVGGLVPHAGEGFNERLVVFLDR